MGIHFLPAPQRLAFMRSIGSAMIAGMTRHRYPQALWVLMLLCLCGARTFAADAPRPNIVFIIADDMGWGDVGFHGGEIQTPNIDKIAAAGVKLEQFYVQPVCSPTRASLMTGRYPMRYGLQVGVVRPWANYGLPLEERMLPAALKEAGYETAICGKWHLGHYTADYLPTHRGFDHQYGHYNGAIDYFTHIRDGGFDWHRDDKVLREEGYSTTLIAAEATKLIRQHDVKSKPLFLYVPFNAVHTPHQVPEKYKTPYAKLPEPRQTYAGMLAAMDEGIGSILHALAETKLLDNTLIIFSSDNGGPGPGKVTSNGKFRGGKGTLYEGGVRVAACAAWNGHISAGSTVDQPLHMVDVYPTLIKIAGGNIEQKLSLDGKDAWATIAQGAPSPHEAILHNAAPKNGAIRVGDWKLILNGSQVDAEEGAPAAQDRQARKARHRGASSDEVELFNIKDDPYEKTNLASANPDKVKELRERYDAFAKEAVPPKSNTKGGKFQSPKVWGEQDQ
jgi:arylsulfatase A-like enzyme